MPDSNPQYNSGLSSLGQEKRNLVAAIALRIRQSLDLDIILDRTVDEVRQFLETDRVSIYRFEPDLSGVIAVESVNQTASSIFGHRIKDPCFTEKHLERYKQGKVHVINNVATSKLETCYAEVLTEFGVQANLVVPIVANQELWGLLIVHHCTAPRRWLPAEIELLKELATQVGIAVQQAELYDRVQSFNSYLEQKVTQRTAELQDAIAFETLTRKVTEKIRDTLDEPQILQTVTREIGQILQIEGCKIELYNSDRTKVTVAYEYTTELPDCQGMTRKIAEFAEFYDRLLRRQTLQFVEKLPELSPLNIQATRLVCPIFDNRGAIGNLWLLRPKEAFFSASEIALVEQIANQCAIAIRQARLYQQSQTQVEELERLNLLKDDFLKTISHELRTPMSSILLASETLETLLERESSKSATFTRVLNIFRSACDRQNQLINDLLTLCYINAKKETFALQWIDLAIWLPEIIEPFQERVKTQQQSLVLNIEDNLPQLKSDITTIERIVTELVNNACKYTPPKETITVAVSAVGEEIELSISNTGTEIPTSEQQRVFDKFYRIPNHDPWKYGGTGIGLALVKNLVELIGGAIDLQSELGTTAFTIYLPREMPQ